MTYDELQAFLGGVGDDFVSRVAPIIESAEADEDSVQLVLEVSREIEKSLKELALCISQALQFKQ